MKRLSPAVFLCAIVVFFVTGLDRADLRQPASAVDRFEVSDVMIPTRDGTKLRTLIFTPRLRPPSPKGFGAAGASSSTAYFKALADEGYVFVFQDLRGKFKSEGEFVMQRPARTASVGAYVTDPKSIDEGTDTYDSICRARGSRSSIGIRRRSCPTSSRRKRATSGQRHIASTAPVGTRRGSTFRSCDR